MRKLYIPLGSVDQTQWVCDSFTFDEVETIHCVAGVCRNVSRYLLDQLQGTNKKYLAVCIPCFDEEIEVFMKTLVSVMENIEFMQKKAKLHDDQAGRALRDEFQRTEVLIVPIFDGMGSMKASVKDWLSSNFPKLTEEMSEEIQVGGSHVRVGCSKWWYYCNDITPKEELDEGEEHEDDIEENIPHEIEDPHARALYDEELQRSNNQTNDNNFIHETHEVDDEGNNPDQDPSNKTNTAVDPDKMIYFHIAPILKRTNHRKHNSLQWFFYSICRGLKRHLSYTFLTSCGTTLDSVCLSRLYYELYFKSDLIGVTGKQKIEYPSYYFHPCETTPIKILKNDHRNGDQTPCWRCYLAFGLSPGPFQGFEYEISNILNTPMYNLVEALPSLPGACQLLNWRKIRKFKVMEEYFNMLFIQVKAAKALPQELPRELKRMKSKYIESQELSPEMKKRMEQMKKQNYLISIQEEQENRKKHFFVNRTTKDDMLIQNLKLAEDRVLSFVSVFSTGFGSKWVPQATFLTEPVIRWDVLLSQRKRWINGTFAAFLHLFLSNAARSRIQGGMFDKHKASKNLRIVNMLWSLQFYQLLILLLFPALFVASFYLSFLDSAHHSHVFSWAYASLSTTGTFRIAELFLGILVASYIYWTYLAFTSPRGHFSETYCCYNVILSFFFAIPIYYSFIHSLVQTGVNAGTGVIIVCFLLPAIVSLGDSTKPAILYLLTLIWFFGMGPFFLMYVPAYALARLWDTSWRDSIDILVTIEKEDAIKTYNGILLFVYFVFTIFLIWGLIALMYERFAAITAIIYLVFAPIMIQLFFSIVFLFIVIPFRNIFSTRKSNEAVSSKVKYGSEYDRYSATDTSMIYTHTESLEDQESVQALSVDPSIDPSHHADIEEGLSPTSTTGSHSPYVYSLSMFNIDVNPRLPGSSPSPMTESQPNSFPSSREDSRAQSPASSTPPTGFELPSSPPVTTVQQQVQPTSHGLKNPKSVSHLLLSDDEHQPTSLDSHSWEYLQYRKKYQNEQERRSSKGSPTYLQTRQSISSSISSLDNSERDHEDISSLGSDRLSRDDSRMSTEGSRKSTEGSRRSGYSRVQFASHELDSRGMHVPYEKKHHRRRSSGSSKELHHYKSTGHMSTPRSPREPSTSRSYYRSKSAYDDGHFHEHNYKYPSHHHPEHERISRNKSEIMRNQSYYSKPKKEPLHLVPLQTNRSQEIIIDSNASVQSADEPLPPDFFLYRDF